jgi:hypothetical protein
MLFSTFRSDKRLKSLSIGHWLGVSVFVRKYHFYGLFRY